MLGHKLDVDRRRLMPIAHQRGRHHHLTKSVRRADAHRLPFAAPQLIRQLVNRLKAMVKRVDFRQQSPSFSGDHQALRAPFEQRKTQLLLGMIEHAADVRLRHV